MTTPASQSTPEGRSVMARTEFVIAVTAGVDAMRTAGLRVALTFDPERNTAAIVVDAGETPLTTPPPPVGPTAEPDEIGGGP